MGLSSGWGRARTRRSVKLIRAAVDVALLSSIPREIYGPYTNEELLAKPSSFREKVVIATKFGIEFGKVQPPGVRNSPAGATQEVAEASLKRLRTDVIDLFYQHRVDPGCRSKT